MRDEVKQEHPGISVTELSKLVGAKWKEKTAEERAPYETKASVDKERYTKEKAEYDIKYPPQVHT